MEAQFLVVCGNTKVENAVVAHWDVDLKEWITLGTTNSDGIIKYSDRVLRGSFLTRVRCYGYRPYEHTVKFNSPTIVGLHLDFYG